MNINLTISKLLSALSAKGQMYKINNIQFYSEKRCKYCTKYSILKRKQIEVYNEDNEEFEMQYKYIKMAECYNKIDVMKYFAEEYSKGSEADGER